MGKLNLTTVGDKRAPDEHRWGTGRLFIEPNFDPRSVEQTGQKRRHYIYERLVQKPGCTWSGLAAFRESRNTRIKSVEASWTVPNCYPPKSSDELYWYTCSSWIGIDGDGLEGDDSKDCVQVGVDSHVIQNSLAVTRWVCAWWQWVPDNSEWIPNFPVSAGDTVDAVVTMNKGANWEAKIHLLNRTSGAATSFRRPKPQNAKFVGNCAIWMVEKTNFAPGAFKHSPRRLASYGEVSFLDAKAKTDDGKEVNLEQRQRLWNIVNDDLEIISDVEVISETAHPHRKIVRCFYKGPTATKHLVPTLIE